MNTFSQLIFAAQPWWPVPLVKPHKLVKVVAHFGNFANTAKWLCGGPQPQKPTQSLHI